MINLRTFRGRERWAGWDKNELVNVIWGPVTRQKAEKTTCEERLWTRSVANCSVEEAKTPGKSRGQKTSLLVRIRCTSDENERNVRWERGLEVFFGIAWALVKI